MTRKDYIATAKLIADQVESASPLFEQSRISAVSDIARGLADIFATDNRRFDRQRFYFACALDENGRPDWEALTPSHHETAAIRYVPVESGDGCNYNEG